MLIFLILLLFQLSSALADSFMPVSDLQLIGFDRIPTGSSSTSNPDATFAYLNANIFTPICAECHNANFHMNNYDFTSYTIALAAVVPGDAANSDMYMATSRGIMPKFGPPLSAALVTDIKDWINAGAQDN